MDTDESIEEIIAVLLSILASIFSLSTFPMLLEGDMSGPAPPAKNRTHFFFRLEKKVSSEIQPEIYITLRNSISRAAINLWARFLVVY